MTITGRQVRAARQLLGWTQEKLAAESEYQHADRCGLRGWQSSPSRLVSVIQQALESAGVIFVEENGEGPGVRLRKKL
jgi:transcriptional regulator with XRE-family HTH domain